MGAINKVRPAESYPPEKGCYLRGNDYSPVAVVVLLRSSYSTWSFLRKPPLEVEELVRASIEAGVALAGTLQTANIGIEKIICNVVSNPNIRYLIICGRELEWYGSGDALKKLVENGVNEKRFIIGSKSLSPYLFNIPLEAINRFRRQVIIIDLIGETISEIIQKAIWSCYQEEPVEFRGYKLYDPGAYPEPPLSVKITWRMTDFWSIMRLLRFSLKPRF